MGRKFAAVVFSLGCLQANSALALGLGELKLESFLNEPLSASVNLLNTGGLHEDEIKVRLGTREDFKRLGIDRSFFLTRIDFDVQIDDDGRARIVMTSDDAVLEPYLDFIVEARWPSGRLLREYTVLIDPPAFSNASTVVSASERVEELEGIPAPGKKKTEVATSGSRVDIRKSDLGPGEMPQRGFNASAADAPIAGDRYMIKRDDTLWTIASRARPAGTSVHQTMLDIQRLNPDAFINNNINRVKAGYIIHLPSAQEISSDDLNAALAEVNEQNAAWREGRDAESAAGQGPTLKISAEDEQLADPVLAGSEELDALEENLDVTGMERADAEGRVAALADRVGTLERIVDLKDEQIAALQAALAEAQQGAAGGDEDLSDALVDDAERRADIDQAYQDAVDADAESDSDEMSDEGTVEAAPATTDQADKPSPEEAVAREPVSEKPVVVAPQPESAGEKSGGFMDYILYIFGAAILAVLGFFLLRRRGDDEVDEDSAADEVFSDVQLSESNLDVAEEPAGMAEELAAVAAAAPAAASSRGYGERKHDAYASDVEAADALAEADIYIAYGRHRQAIELLNNALHNEPNNPVYRLKLIEIHTELNNHDEASEQLHQLRSIGDPESVAAGEELIASMESAATGEAAAAPQEAVEAPVAASDEPGLAPNPYEAGAGAEGDGDFSGLEIEDEYDEVDDEESGDIDLSDDFSDEEELVIADDANGMSTKLDLARAYIDMGDDDGARQILEEVVAEGNDELKAEAQALLDRIG